MKRLISLTMIFSLLGLNTAYGAGETKSSVAKKYRIIWSEYRSDIYTEIKTYEKNKNCNGLQYIFDLAVLNNKAHARQYGHNNANLMIYIDQVLRRAKCYGK